MARNSDLTAHAKRLRRDQTAAEERVWSLLRAGRLAGLKFRRQHVIGRHIVDFACIAARLVIEIDGDTHGDAEAQGDAERTREIERAGFRVVRFWNDDVFSDRDGDVADAILAALRTPPRPSP